MIIEKPRRIFSILDYNLKLLFVIPARGGSKGIPGKNIKSFMGKPLIHHSIEFARLFAVDEDICVSTDSPEITSCAKQLGLLVPFERPSHLATDEAGSFEVLQYALSFYLSRGVHYEALVLLQPTSPIRKRQHMEDALKLYEDQLDMVVSVKKSKANPYYNLFEENKKGYLVLSKGNGQFHRRQDIPDVYEYNGSIYIINSRSLLLKKSFNEFDATRKYIMDEEYSLDLDTLEEWKYAEYKMKEAKS
ncbi:MAG TPA: acylneuraminate cytidylyltransferase family protein [Puia sp.]|jgi:N-acylneuraminate cytidylyltransferase|nr:acylneuraminate cytidylyltransferase family protein [Puia sp.]